MIVKKTAFKIELPKRNLPKKLSTAFERQMMMRNYKGTLKVDHDNRVIIISVATHKIASDPPSNNNSNRECEDGSEKENCYNGAIAKQRRQRVQDLKGKRLFLFQIIFEFRS